MRPAVGFSVGGSRGALAKIAATALLGGVVEALFLVTVTRTAFAITDDDDRVGIIAGRYVSVYQALLIALALVAIRLTFSVSAMWQGVRLSNTVVTAARRRLAKAFLHSSWAVQQQQQSGSLQELMSGYAPASAGITSAVNQGLIAACNLIALIGMAVAVDPLGALILIVSVSVLGTVLRPLRTVVRRRAHRTAEVGMDLSTSVNEASTLGLELHVFNVQDQALGRIDSRIERARRENERLGLASGLATPVYVGLAYVALVGALSFVAVSAATSLTSLGVAMLVMLRSLSYGQALQGSYVNLSSTAPVIDELVRRMNILEQGQDEGGNEAVGKVETLEAEHVSFSYVPEQGVLHDVSFEIPPREIVGIVGPSGGGKSTLVQLLLGLREPDAGRILADGRDIRSFRREDWARKVTFVPQAAHFVRGTVADNIRFLRDDVSDDDIEAAARLAHLHDDICGFPEGYQREVGEQGGHLSGGQQQRLTIARALVEHPDVLILDEPTSALDVRSEHLVRTTLLSLKDRMTIIVIAHRLSTLDICDRIMVIQGGHLMGLDTPTRLEQTNDFYREALALSGLR